MNVRKKGTCHAGLGNPLQFCSGVTGICHAHYGGISSGWGTVLPGGVVCTFPLVVIGSEADQPSDKRAQKAAFDLFNGRRLCFVLSALKFPSVTGSSSHPTGTGLGAILFGPTPMQ